MNAPREYLIREVALGSAAAQDPNAVIIQSGTTHLDVSDMLRFHIDLGAAFDAFQKSPYDYRPLIAMRNLGVAAATMHRRMPRSAGGGSVAHQVRALQAQLANALKMVQTSAKIRIKAAHDMARRPLQLVPLCWNLGFGTTSDALQVRNPYLGSSGGQAVLTEYKAPWSITAFRTSNNENGQLMPIRMMQWLIGGHDYVSAALGGLSQTGPIGIDGFPGWPAAAFTETARKHHSTAFEPWNLTAESSAGWGFIMTETGFLQVKIRNAAASGTFVDGWSVYVRATLCGSPFDRNSDTVHMANAFVPIGRQTAAAYKIASDWSNNVSQLAGTAFPVNAAPWGAQVANAEQAITSFLEAPPPSLGDPLEYDHPAWGQVAQ